MLNFRLESWYALGQAEDETAKHKREKGLEAAFNQACLRYL
jgi:hypothetical protein